MIIRPFPMQSKGIEKFISLPSYSKRNFAFMTLLEKSKETNKCLSLLLRYDYTDGTQYYPKFMQWEKLLKINIWNLNFWNSSK